MNYLITEQDKALVCQPSVSCKLRISIRNTDRNIIGVLTGIPQIGSYDIDADSDIRRVASLDIKLDDLYSDIEEKIASWLNLTFLFELGILDIRSDEYHYYPAGSFLITDAGTSYNASANMLSLSLSDEFARFDGTRNGQMGGAPTITIPVEYEGSKNTLKSALLSILSADTTITDYIIEDIGEYKGMPQNNSDYEEYRLANPDWNTLPYDLEFGAGDTLSDMLTEIRDLYPNCQLYFDVYNNLCFNMIPSNSNVPLTLDDGYIQKLLLADDSESVRYDVSGIKNVTEVFGQTYDIDRFCETCTGTGDTYSLTLKDYTKYNSNEIIVFTASASNTAAHYIQINGLEKLPLYHEYTTDPVAAGTIAQGDISAIKIVRKSSVWMAYYLGQYQPHAICVLTSNANDPEYPKSYFAAKYNCLEKNIAFVEVRDSPFSIQRLGEILDTKSGDEFDTILSDSVALENAKLYNYKTSNWNDTVTVHTKLLPWLDVHAKIEYRKKQENTIYTYITKKISHDFASGTTAVTMCRFSNLYQE